METALKDIIVLLLLLLLLFLFSGDPDPFDALQAWVVEGVQSSEACVE